MSSGSTTVIVGAQWGDEGKGKVIHYFADQHDVIVRFQGGANAGHGAIHEGRKRVLHLLPWGIFSPAIENVVGPEVVCDLDVLVEELAIASEQGSTVWLDPSAPIALSLHKMLDAGREEAATHNGGTAIGTTRRGIGPVHEDLAGRRAMRLGDLESPGQLREAIDRYHFYNERAMLLRHYRMTPPSREEIFLACMQAAPRIIGYLADTRSLVAQRLRSGKRVLFEGGQGLMLDPVIGPSPFVTSARCTPAEVSNSFGVYNFDRVIGVSKVYTTYIGGGPFPCEMDEHDADEIRERGDEFGATTGRPRRCGWLDLVALRYACRMGGLNGLILTKLDVLAGCPKIPVVVDYEGLDLGRWLDADDTLTLDILQKAQPKFAELKGWSKESLIRATSEGTLSDSMKDFVEFVEGFVKVQVLGVSTGPEQGDFISLQDF